MWPDRQAPVPNASFFEAPPKIWWGTGTKDLTNAKGFFRSGGALQLVLSTGQELEADFNGTFVKVRARDGEVVYARFEKGQLHWLEQNPFGKKAETWHLLPPLETQEMSESQLSLLQTPVVALAANTEGEALWSKNKIQKVLEELDPKENSITLVSCLHIDVISVQVAPCLPVLDLLSVSLVSLGDSTCPGLRIRGCQALRARSSDGARCVFRRRLEPTPKLQGIDPWRRGPRTWGCTTC